MARFSRQPRGECLRVVEAHADDRIIVALLYSLAARFRRTPVALGIADIARLVSKGGKLCARDIIHCDCERSRNPDFMLRPFSRVSTHLLFWRTHQEPAGRKLSHQRAAGAV